MGSRASFWVGNPQDLSQRQWLGCVAFDGYPEGFEGLDTIDSEVKFREFVEAQSSRDDFAAPENGWPYPWDDNIFLTDYTYAFFDGILNIACFRHGFFTLSQYNEKGIDEIPESLPSNIPAPSKYNRDQPDSIIMIGFKRK